MASKDNPFGTTPGDGDVFDPDANNAQPKKKPQPAYQVYEGSKVAVSKALGKLWKQRYTASKATYELTWKAWDDAFEYFNAHQGVELQTPRGRFRRGDGTENVVYANTNVMLSATYNKNPDASCSTVDDEDQAFCDTLQALLKVLMDREDKLYLKPKAKRAVGFALLTNCGVIKLDYTGKDDSREVAIEEMTAITDKLKTAADVKEVNQLYSQLEALESQMEVRKPSGVAAGNVLPQKLIMDPYAELPNGTDGAYMMEEAFINTGFLAAKFTKKDEEGSDVLIFKPTHKVSLTAAENARDDGLGMVLEAMGADTTMPTHFTEEERLSYLYNYYTECVYVWDKTTRRVFLYLKDDWTWPIWVWDDPLHLTRFFPYFVVAFGMNTGRSTTVGEVNYYLDQQDEINDINRQRNRIRRSVFDYFFYNKNKVAGEEVEAMVAALRGDTSQAKHAIGLNLDDGQKVADVVEALLPPSADYAVLFDKSPANQAMNRTSNTNDALRGEQFKTNTNVSAVETYQQAARLAIDSKVDPIEDMLSEFLRGVAELAVQFMSPDEVAGLIGRARAAGWRNMTVEEFNATYTLTIVAGSTEKPNSAFKKKEAIQLAQALGQFAAGAPGASMMMMLKLFQKAFNDFMISPQDWQMLQQEIMATLQKGISTGGGAEQGAPQGRAQQGEGAPQQGAPQPGGNAQIDALLAKVPPQVKEQVAQAAKAGASPQQVVQMLEKAAGGSVSHTPPQQQGVH